MHLREAGWLVVSLSHHLRDTPNFIILDTFSEEKEKNFLKLSLTLFFLLGDTGHFLTFPLDFFFTPTFIVASLPLHSKYRDL